MNVLGIILTSGQVIAALTGIAVFVGLAWRAGRKVVTWGKKMEAIIGSNGGTSLFDAIVMLGSIVDLIQQPSIFCSTDGEVYSVSAPFVEATGWTYEHMAHGGFRGQMSEKDRDAWDESVQHHSTFARRVTAGRQTLDVTARPIFNQTKFLGWRVAITPLGKNHASRSRQSPD